MPPSATDQLSALSVTQLVDLINETLSFAYPNIVVEGEISSFKINQGKYVFFDLKDDTNVVNCFMMVYALKLPLEDGMKVVLSGTPKLGRFSKFSLTVKSYEVAGEGHLRRAMELLKAKLTAEGLFDPGRKRSLPKFPQTIGLITSGTSAAYADFCKILAQRWGGLRLQLADVTVQGQTAPDQIVAAIETFNQMPQPPDVLVIIRGGGSLEDLMAFSTEPVARAVAASRTPTIVGVGHEIDVSLADYAADVRAATPTDAARIVVPDRREIWTQVEALSGRIHSCLQTVANTCRHQLDQALVQIEQYLNLPRQRVQTAELRLWHHLERLRHQHQTMVTQINVLERRLGTVNRIIGDNRRQLNHNLQLLAGYNPNAVLKRGYAIVRHHGAIVTRSSNLKTGDEIMIQLAEDQLVAEVKE